MKTQKIYRVLLVAALFQFIALVSSAQVTITAYIKGQTQGEIKGEFTAKGPETGTIECIGYNDEVLSPRDPQSGLPTGKRMEKPLVITTHFDSSTPKLLQAMYTNENLTQVYLELVRPNAAGVPTVFAKIQLANANIASINQVFDKSANSLEKGTISVKIALTFQKITFTYTAGGITASDVWMATR
jgi:type VI secretion system secreted protein Hcp